MFIIIRKMPDVTEAQSVPVFNQNSDGKDSYAVGFTAKLLTAITYKIKEVPDMDTQVNTSL
jgi:hypothetical protein